jgi:hypothetical protein
MRKLYKLLNPDWDLTFPPLELRKDDIIVKDDNREILKQIGIDGTILYTPGHTNHWLILQNKGN